MTDQRYTLILSPHLDDAVFSASHAFGQGRTMVITVFTGEGDTHGLNGFTGDYALYADMKTRKREDSYAMRMMPGTVLPIYLDLPDKLFRKDDDEVRRRLKEGLQQYATQYRFDKIYCPLGVGEHPDHLLVYEVARTVFSEMLYYCEYPYSNISLNLRRRCAATERLPWLSAVKQYYTHPIYQSTPWYVRAYRIITGLRPAAVLPGRLEAHPAGGRKFAAMLCYETQIKPIFGSRESLERELSQYKNEYTYEINKE